MRSVDIRARAPSLDRRSPRWWLRLVSCLLLTWFLSASSVEGAGLAPSQVVRLWIVFLDQHDTLHAAGFTTAGFRQGEAPAVWAAHTYAVLHWVHYHHLGGEIVTAAVSEMEATIVLGATIHTRLGTITQKETYRLRRHVGRWLIDGLEVTDQVRHGHNPEDNSREVRL
jgi:hypothetical protein